MNSIVAKYNLMLGACSMLMFASIGALALDEPKASGIKTLSSLNMKIGKNILPLQISPIQVEAPARRIDLQVETDRDSGRTARLLGVPNDLNAYPILNMELDRASSSRLGLILEADSQGEGSADYLLQIGNPDLFPDMLDTHFDFQGSKFAQKDYLYSLMRKVGLGTEGPWRYTPQNVTVNSTSSGIVEASFMPGGDFVLSKGFDSFDIERAPWLSFKYKLPENQLWTVQINAKVDIDGLNRDVILLSPPVSGGGERELRCNLIELLRQASPFARKGKLNDLIVHFILDPSSSEVKNARIILDQLNFFREQLPAQGNLPNKLLFVTDFSKSINLVQQLEKFGVRNELAVLRGSLIGVEGKEGVLPSIKLQANFREKLPKVFVGDESYLNELSAREVDAVLDQKLFLKEQVVWHGGRSKEIVINQVESSESEVIELARFESPVGVGKFSYIKADFDFEEGAPLPVYVTLNGTDHQGKKVSLDRLLLNNRPVKVGSLALRNVIISLRRGDTHFPMPSSFKLNNIDIREVKKTRLFSPERSAAVLLLDDIALTEEAIQPATRETLWAGGVEFIDYEIQSKDDLQTIKTFQIHKQIKGNTYALIDMTGEGNYLRVVGENSVGRIEQLFPLNGRSRIKLPEMVLHNVDLVKKNESHEGIGQAELRRLEIFLEDGLEDGREIWSIHGVRHVVGIKGSADLKTVATFDLNKKIIDGTVLDYALELASGPAMSYLFRIKGKSEIGPFSRLIPLALEGRIPFSGVTIQSIDLVVRGGDAAIPTSINVNQLRLREGGVKGRNSVYPIGAELTYADILTGHKLIDIPLSVINDGMHLLEYESNGDISLSIDPAYIEHHSHLATGNTSSPAPKSKVVYLVAGLLSVLFIYFVGGKLLRKWLPLESYPLVYEMGFGTLLLSLLVVSLYFMMKSQSVDAYSWGSLLLVLSYSVAVRWKIRRLLSRTWPNVANRHSAPYLLLLTVILILCAGLLMMQWNSLAEKLAVICYFLLVFSMAAEFTQFAGSASEKGGEEDQPIMDKSC